MKYRYFWFAFLGARGLETIIKQNNSKKPGSNQCYTKQMEHAINVISTDVQ